MNSLFRLSGLTALVLAAAIGFVGCDSNDDPDPVVTTAFCETSPTAFGCTDSGSRYDTTGTDVNGRPIIEVRDTSGGVGGANGTDPRANVTWSSGFTYVLDGLVFVNPGQTLTIEPGTVIRARSGQGRNSSALVVARDARIEANGTADAPIIMTALNDDLDTFTDLVQDGAPQSGLWGGLIVLGRAPTNIDVGFTNIEGIDATEERGRYGGEGAEDANDDSGVIRYVSIRHGGTLIGEGNEINGFTLGAVGAGTTIEYVEVFANQDDGIEWFGGTAQAKYLAVSYCGDDMFDYDQGYNGVNQYVFGLMASSFGDNGGEHDGGDDDLGGEDSAPFAIPTFANATYIGSGLSAANSSRVMTIRDNAGAKYWRSVFYDFQNGVRIEDRDDEDTEENEGGDSRDRAESGDVNFIDVVFSNVGASTPTFDGVFRFYEEAPEGDEAVDQADLLGPVSFGNPGFSITRSQGGALSLQATAPAPTVDFPAGVTFLDDTDFVGAVGSTNWLQGWTALSQFQTIN